MPQGEGATSKVLMIEALGPGGPYGRKKDSGVGQLGFEVGAQFDGATNVTISLATTGRPDPDGQVIPLHLAALAAAFVWFVGRRTQLTIRPLFALDGLGTMVVLGAYAVVGFKGASHAPERASLLLMLITICALTTRAILVPSTLTHTIGVSQGASLPVLIITYQAASKYPHAYGMAPVTAVIYMSI